MKTNKVLLLVSIVSAAFALSAQAGDRHKGNNQAAYKSGGNSGAQVRSVSPRFTQRSGGYSSMGRNFQSSPRMTMRSMPTRTFSQRSTFNSSGNVASFNQRRFTPETFNRSNRVARFQNTHNFGTIQDNRVNRLSSLNNTDRSFNHTGEANRFARSGNSGNLGQLQGQRRDAITQLQGQHFNRTAQFGNGGRNRTIGNISPGHNHVFAQRSANWNSNWDRHCDHWWNGHRCRWVNNSWFIFDIGFVPWFGWPYADYYAYDYYPPVYPYSYGYGYDPGVYDQSAYYDQGGYNYNDQSNYDQSGNGSGYSEQTAAMVADVQDQLARAGYYQGQIDGVLGPETRHALVRYQSDKGLRVTGSLTMETQQSLGLTAQGAGGVTSDQ